MSDNIKSLVEAVSEFKGAMDKIGEILLAQQAQIEALQSGQVQPVTPVTTDEQSERTRYPYDSNKYFNDGIVYTATVAEIREAGALLIMANGTKGWLPLASISDDFVEDIRDYLYEDQHIKVERVHGDPFKNPKYSARRLGSIKKMDGPVVIDVPEEEKETPTQITLYEGHPSLQSQADHEVIIVKKARRSPRFGKYPKNKPYTEGMKEALYEDYIHTYGVEYPVGRILQVVNGIQNLGQAIKRSEWGTTSFDSFYTAMMRYYRRTRKTGHNA